MPSKKVILTTSEKEVPVVTFANGTVKESRKRQLKVSAHHNANHRGRGKRQKMLVVESSKMAYRGDNYGPLSVPEQSTQLYVAEVNKVTGQMTMFPSELFHLHPVAQVAFYLQLIAHYKEHNMSGADIVRKAKGRCLDLQRERLELESMSFREKTDLLTDAFGSRKQKRAVQQRQRSKVAEKAVTSAMGSAVDLALTTHQAQPVPEPQETSSAIPPYNKDAQSPADVYSLHDIIGPVELDSLRHAAEAFKNCSGDTLKEWTEKKEYHNAVLARLRVMPMGDQQRQDRACLLLYLHYMLSMFLLKYDQMRKRDPLPEQWPDAVKRMMLDRFTVKMDGQRRCIPARVKDLLLSHILVLCLIVDGYTTSLADLLKDLKISVNRLHTHVRALGCRVKTDSSNKDLPGVKVTSSEAVLTVPLTFPDPSRQRKPKTK